jgi:hypothetical protein
MWHRFANAAVGGWAPVAQGEQAYCRRNAVPKCAYHRVAESYRRVERRRPSPRQEQRPSSIRVALTLAKCFGCSTGHRFLPGSPVRIRIPGCARWTVQTVSAPSWSSVVSPVSSWFRRCWSWTPRSNPATCPIHAPSSGSARLQPRSRPGRGGPPSAGTDTQQCRAGHGDGSSTGAGDAPAAGWPARTLSPNGIPDPRP